MNGMRLWRLYSKLTQVWIAMPSPEDDKRTIAELQLELKAFRVWALGFGHCIRHFRSLPQGR